MPIVPAQYSKSRALYAIDWSTFRVDRWPSGGAAATVTAVWTVCKKGRVQVSKATLHHTFSTNSYSPEPATRESFEDNFDPRYGGAAQARWDGEYMWAPDTTLARMNELAVELDPVLASLPTVPAGYDGWYTLGRARERGMNE